MNPGAMVGRRVRYWDQANPLAFGTVSAYVAHVRPGHGRYEITWDAGSDTLRGRTFLPESVVDHMRVETPETRGVASWALLPVATCRVRIYASLGQYMVGDFYAHVVGAWATVAEAMSAAAMWATEYGSDGTILEAVDDANRQEGLLGDWGSAAWMVRRG